MTRDAIQALFDRRRAAYERLDAASLAADYAEDCVIESPIGGTHQGRAAAEQVLRTVFDAFGVKVYEQKRLIDGDVVAQVFELEGIDTGQFLGLSPTGKAFRVPAVFLYELRDGAIAHERRIYDFTGVLVQIGLLKAKPTS